MSSAKGSRLQVQIYVNRRPSDLATAIVGALPSLSKQTRTICWTAPLEHEDFAEPRDEDFLRAVGYGELADSLREFWPARGPVWDALGLAVFPDRRPGVILAEGKSYPNELFGPGTKATEASRSRIADAIGATQSWLHVPVDPENWLGRLYQSANRLAHLYWLREIAGVEAWLVHVLFLDDHTHVAASRKDWESALTVVEGELGEAKTPYAANVLLPALAADELTREPVSA